MLYNHLSVNSAGHLTFAGYDTCDLAQRYGTPLMLMDEALVRARCREYKAAMAAYLPAGSRPLYASKALAIKGIYEIMAQEDMDVDLVSAGEIFTAYKAGFPLERGFFHGNAKTDADIALAMDLGVGFFVCDNTDELEAIEAEAARRDIRQKVILRLTPGIDPHTHEKINTGRIDSKFGAAVETGQAEQLILLALSKPHIDLQGYHCHIGSQIFEIDPFCDAAALMAEFVAQFRDKHGYSPAYLNLGGGMGVPYTAADSKIDYTDNIRRIGERLDVIFREYDLTPPAILMEPGRSIVADAGLTLYSVASIKQIPGFKNYVAINGGMTDNPRYTLYQSSYTVELANRMEDKKDFCCTIAGCCCESGDLIQEDVLLPQPKRGDLVAVLTTGAYNYSMASNYNRVPRPPIVFVGEKGPYVAVRRETHADLLLCDL